MEKIITDADMKEALSRVLDAGYVHYDDALLESIADRLHREHGTWDIAIIPIRDFYATLAEMLPED